MQLKKLFQISIPLLAVFITLLSCKNKNIVQDESLTTEERTVATPTTEEQVPDTKLNEVYVPIYSDIYSKTQNDRTLLTATLSIRNTSHTDTLFITNIDYYNTAGDIVRRYIDQPIFLKPVETIDYVIEERDDLGGSGANFIIEWYSNKPIKPLFQAIHIGGLGAQAFSFTTDGISTK